MLLLMGENYAMMEAGNEIVIFASVYDLEHILERLHRISVKNIDISINMVWNIGGTQ